MINIFFLAYIQCCAVYKNIADSFLVIFFFLCTVQKFRRADSWAWQ